MAEQTKPTKVLELYAKEGGISLGSHGVQNTLPRQIKGIEMELATNLGGVLVKYPHRQTDGKVEPKTLLIPMSHIKHLELG